MAEEKRLILMKVVTVGLGLTSLVFISNSVSRVLNKWRIVRRAKSLGETLRLKLRDPLPTTTIVTSQIEWENVYSVIARDVDLIPVVGFDCEWVTLKDKVQPVALIQIASQSGTCALIRVCCMSTIPSTLKNLLNNPTILKVGVATWEDALKLKKDLGIQVQGTYDIRYLIHKHPKREKLFQKSGLLGLTENVLGETLNKKFSLRCSDWEAENLSEEQLKYAAQDAIASIAICLKMVAETDALRAKLWHFHNFESFYQYWTKSSTVVDVRFRMPKSFIRNSSPLNKSSSSNSQIKSSSTRAYATRKTALYDNCILQAPDGQQLCTCDTKKAMWYVERNRGDVVAENPLTVRLNFEPAGRPSSEYDRYYLLDKENKCVVCGQQDSILRKNVVPHEYRKHFPSFLKDHKSHDILLLCLECHVLCSQHDHFLKNQLAEECSAPIGTEKDVKTKLDKRLSGVQRACNALINSRSCMPANRIAELEDLIKDYYQVDVVSTEVLEWGRDLEVNIPNVSYVPHGLKVVRHFEEHHDLLTLERRWREHFLNTMNPMHMPELWSVEHNRKPEEKWGGDDTAADSISSPLIPIQ